MAKKIIPNHPHCAERGRSFTKKIFEIQVNKFFDWIQYWLTKNTKNIKACKPCYRNPDSSVAKIELTVDRSRKKKIFLTIKDAAVFIRTTNVSYPTIANHSKGEITKLIKECAKGLRA